MQLRERCFTNRQGVRALSIARGYKSKASQPYDNHSLDYLFAVIVTLKLVASVLLWAESFEQTEQGIVSKVAIDLNWVVIDLNQLVLDTPD